MALSVRVTRADPTIQKKGTLYNVEWGLPFTLDRQGQPCQSDDPNQYLCAVRYDPRAEGYLLTVVGHDEGTRMQSVLTEARNKTSSMDQVRKYLDDRGRKREEDPKRSTFPVKSRDMFRIILSDGTIIDLDWEGDPTTWSPPVLARMNKTDPNTHYVFIRRTN